MKQTLTFFLLLLIMAIPGYADVTLDYCLQRAEENYPEIKKYGLLESTSELSLEEINRGWWPRLGLTAQANLQNIVPAFPDILQNNLAHKRHRAYKICRARRIRHPRQTASKTR